jgi:glycosyltransferase involved in cell wall biosynthesis
VPRAGDRLSVALDATPLFGNVTGVGMVTRALVDGLSRDPRLEVAAWVTTWRRRREIPIRLPHVRTSRLPMPARVVRAAWERVDWPPVQWWTGAVDVVHGTNYVGPPARGAAEVVSVYDLTPVRFPELCTRDTLTYPGLLRRACRRGAVAHTTSDFVKGEVVELLGWPEERVRTVYPGVPPAPVDAGDPLGPGPPYVLALGTIEPRKNLPRLLDAFDLVAEHQADLRLVVAGADGWGAEAFAAALDHMHHRSRVTRLGYVAEAERVDLLRGAQALIYPSLYEGFGFPPLEAMAMGIPVVASDAGSLPEVLGDAARVAPATDVEALAAAIEAVVDDAGLRAALVAAGQRRVQRYSWANFIDGIVDLYDWARADA